MQNILPNEMLLTSKYLPLSLENKRSVAAADSVQFVKENNYTFESDLKRK